MLPPITRGASPNRDWRGSESRLGIVVLLCMCVAMRSLGSKCAKASPRCVLPCRPTLITVMTCMSSILVWASCLGHLVH